MNAPTRRLRTRLLVAMLAIAFGVLVLTAAVTAGLARRTATNSARRDLQNHAPVVADQFDEVFASCRRLRACATAGTAPIRKLVRDLIQTTLRVSDGAIIAFDANGQQREILGRIFGTESALIRLPSGVNASDLDTSRLLSGTRQTGQDGNTVFVAVPLEPIQSLTPVVVLAEHVESRPFGQSNTVVIIAAAIALVAAALVAAYLARRMTRPLAAMQTTAGRIAGGDLSARVDVRHVPDDELGSLARAINGMAQELDAARGHERTFLLSVSHDLRTPLTSIKGYAEAIADGTVQGMAARVHAAEVIASEARRLERLVADLLDLARLDAHEFSLTPRPIDASEVVGETVDAFRPSAAEIGVDLVFEPRSPAPVDADPERLAQIIANLVENALKYARSRVTVGLRPGIGSVELRVDDDGPGIHPSDLPHVFERLYTSRTVPGRKVGTGIGLAIVHELAAAMGGSARVEPLDSMGTRFVVMIPAGASQPVGLSG